MNNEELINQINLLKEELDKTKNELIETKEHLKKYTAPSNMKKYYQNHKEEIIKKVKEYKEKNNYNPIIDKEKRIGSNEHTRAFNSEQAQTQPNQTVLLHPNSG